MKNHIKMIIIFGIVSSFFPVYTMVAPNGYMLEPDSLKYVNPLLNMKKLTVFPLTGGYNISDEDPFFNRKEVALKLTIVKFFEKSAAADKETLETICDAVSRGIPITSKHLIQPNMTKSGIMISPCPNSTSVFVLIENWAKFVWFAGEKKDLLKEAIFQGERKRKERLKYIRGQLEENAIPKDLEPEFLSYLPEDNVSEERTELIKQAEQEFHKEKQSQLSLFKMSAYLEQIMRRVVDYE